MSLVTWQAVSNRDGSLAAHKLQGLGAARGPWLWLPADCGARPVRQVYRSCLRLYAMKARRHKAAVKLARDTKLGRMDDFPATQKTCKAPLLRCELDLQFPAADLESRPSRQPQMQIANHRSANEAADATSQRKSPTSVGNGPIPVVQYRFKQCRQHRRSSRYCEKS